MGLKHRTCDHWDGITGFLRPFTFTTPNDVVAHIVSAETGDNWSAGADMPTLDNQWLPIPMSLVYTMVDAGNNLDLTVQTYGINQFGEKVSETVVCDVTGGGGATVYGTQVFARVDRVYVVSTANNAVADTFSLGFETTNANVLFGLPVRIRKHSSVGIADGANGSPNDSIKTIHKAGALNIATITVNEGQSAIKDSGPFAIDQVIQVTLGAPFGDE